jgi:hypothetical protein
MKTRLAAGIFRLDLVSGIGDTEGSYLPKGTSTRSHEKDHALVRGVKLVKDSLTGSERTTAVYTLVGNVPIP